MQVKLLIALPIALLAACSNVKEYPNMDLVEPSMRIATQWVSASGAWSNRQHSQLPAVVFDETLYIATSNGNIGSVDILNGKIKWVAHLQERLTAGPAVSDQFLVVSNDSAEVLLLDKSSGELKWRSPVASIVLSTPLIVENQVIIQTVTGKVVALNIETGVQNWLESREVPSLTIRGTSGLILVDDKIITGFANGKVAALDINSGKTIWDTALATARGRSDLERVIDVDGVFYVDNSIVFAAAYQGRVAALSLDNGDIIWSRDMSSYTGVVSDGKNLYITDAEGNVWSLDAKTGATLWRQTKMVGRDVGTPALIQSFVVVGDGSGLLHWLSKEDGKLSAQQDLNKVYIDETVLIDDDEQIEDRKPAVTTIPVVVDQNVIVRDNAGGLTAFRLIPQS
ncbi:MAG: outer membrane protein assembly factor BamB [Thiohalomonadales bacterium]